MILKIPQNQSRKSTHIWVLFLLLDRVLQTSTNTMKSTHVWTLLYRMWVYLSSKHTNQFFSQQVKSSKNVENITVQIQNNSGSLQMSTNNNSLSRQMGTSGTNQNTSQQHQMHQLFFYTCCHNIYFYKENVII